MVSFFVSKSRFSDLRLRTGALRRVRYELVRFAFNFQIGERPLPRKLKDLDVVYKKAAGF